MALLLIENIAGKAFGGCPLKINEVSYGVPSKGILDLQHLIGKKVGSIEVNGMRRIFNPGLLIQKGTQFKVQCLINGTLSFQNETPELID